MRSDHPADRLNLRSRCTRSLLGAALVGAISLGSAPAYAQADIEIDAPTESTVGEVVVVTATVTDGGAPVVAATVGVTRKAVIGGVSGFAELDRGITDAAGAVELEFVQLADSSEIAEFRVEYHGPDGIEAADFQLTVLPGSQQYSSSSGADIGILNVSWLIIVLALIWMFALIAAWQFVAISRNRKGEAKRRHHLIPYYMFGFVAVTAIGMFVVVLTQPTMHANLAPNESFDRIPTAYVGEQYDYLGLGANDVGSRPDDLSGEVLYVQAGCASCHGVGGQGAIVGGELTGSMVSDNDEVIEAIRRGPGGMPKYSETLLSDEEIDRIIQHILDANGG